MLTQVSSSARFRVAYTKLLHLANPGSPPDATFSESAIWYFDEVTKKITRS